jgi:hypothetical protein
MTLLERIVARKKRRRRRKEVDRAELGDIAIAKAAINK